jgi:hypothetical protein
MRTGVPHAWKDPGTIDGHLVTGATISGHIVTASFDVLSCIQSIGSGLSRLHHSVGAALNSYSSVDVSKTPSLSAGLLPALVHSPLAGF